MKQKDDLSVLEYDDDAALEFILNLVPEEFRARIDEDKINYVLDVVYDFYDEKGYIDEDAAEEAQIDEEEMATFIVKAAKKDKIDLTEDEIQFILDSEFEYGVSIGVYSEEE